MNDRPAFASDADVVQAWATRDDARDVLLICVSVPYRIWITNSKLTPEQLQDAMKQLPPALLQVVLDWLSERLGDDLQLTG